MLVKASPVFSSISTKETLKRSFTGVDSLVYGEDVLLGKCFIAARVRTSIRSFAGVGPHVFVEVTTFFCSVCAARVRTSIGSFASVGSFGPTLSHQVQSQVGG